MWHYTDQEHLVADRWVAKAVLLRTPRTLAERREQSHAVTVGLTMSNHTSSESEVATKVNDLHIYSTHYSDWLAVERRSAAAVDRLFSYWSTFHFRLVALDDLFSSMRDRSFTNY